MSKAKLKKVLNSLEKEEIINTVIELYEARKEAKEYLEYWLEPDADKELEKCQKLIERQFRTPQGVSKRSPQQTVVNKIIKDFMSICFEPEKVAELMMHTAIVQLNWINEKYRGVSHRTALQKRVTELEQYIETHELEDTFGIKLERLRNTVSVVMQMYENDDIPYPRRRRRRYW